MSGCCRRARSDQHRHFRRFAHVAVSAS
ncbi:hypothetical protein [Mesorhizobium sp.]